jgi:hypothetical protein
MLSRTKFEIRELINKMLDKLPQEVFTSKSTTFCDLQIGGGQFIFEIVNRLRVLGHSDDNIRSRVFGFAENKLYYSYVMGKYSDLPVTFDIYKEEINMKFDVVIGNPPYQRSTSKTHKLWVEFLKKSILLSKNYVAFVTPSLLFTGNSKRIKDLREQVISKITYCDFDVNKFFNVSEDICFYILKPHGENNLDVEVKMKNGVIEKQSVSQGTLYHSKDGEIVKNIIKKIEEKDLPKWELISDISNTDGYNTVKNLLNQGTISEVMNDEYPYEFVHSGNQRYFTRNPSIFGNGLKVVLNFSSTYENMFVTNGVLGKQVEGIMVENMEDANKIIRILTSKIFKFYIKKEKSGGFNSGIFKLPKLDINKIWSDENLYNLFDLTEQEINYIESNVS